MCYIKKLSLLLFILTASNFSSTAQRWKFIGDKIAAYGPDRDVLWVTGNDMYRQVKLRVTDAPLHIVDMKIYFENGEKMDVALKNN